MGYELEARLPSHDADGDHEADSDAVERLWCRAHDRLAACLAHARSLRGRVATDDPRWHAAQLALAEARHACREAEDAFVRTERPALVPTLDH